MDKDTRNLISSTTQAIRRLLEEEFSLQLEGTFDIHDDGRIAAEAGPQLTPSERFTRQRIVEAIQHRRAVGESAAESIRGFRAEAVFTCFNRLAALRMMEARGLVLPCVSQGDQSQGFKEFSGLAPGLVELPDKGYRLYLECLFDEIGREVGVLFDRTDAASQLWPRRKALEAVLAKLNTPELAGVWAEDETIGWIYQYFNDEAERKQMREESSAPRNSRELAVRNQFFTPRYVVEFLTDNTLGRLWYEMTKGQTRLKDQCRYLVRRPTEVFLAEGQAAPTLNPAADNCSQEDLLRQPVHIPHRPLKDPREIRLLDPACGSMHFGLHAFDLFTVIYDEAWEVAHGPDDVAKSAETFAPFVTFAASFPDKAAFLREVPRLIVEHNIHGIDIDPRAAQIAGLSLWLRAQRAWHQAGVKPADRPRITRSNLVCAEPMPGEKELLGEFVEQQFPLGERPIFQHFLESIFEKMKLAGEAGSLLRIEEEIRTTIEEARAAWEKLQSRPLELFSTTELNRVSSAPELTGLESALTADHRPLTTDFWQAAEQRIYDALEAYAERAENGGGFQRRLFAADAAQGFAFIDLCRKRYDVVVMNPPFGKPAKRSLKYLQDTYPDDWKDIYAAFFTRTQGILATGGLLGAITSLLFLYSKQLRTLRHLLIEKKRLQFVVELGGGVLDNATVETSLSLISKEETDLTAFLDLTCSSNRGADLLHASQTAGFQLQRLQDFTSIFGWPLCYHVQPGKLALWKHKGRVEPELAEIVAGNHTFDDFRFLRLRWEVNASAIAKSWIPYEKGGDFQPFFSPTNLLFNWENDGAEARAYQIGEYGTDAQTIQSITNWFKSGITYPRVSSIGFSPRVLPAGCIFSEKGMSIFPNNADDGLPLVALLSSSWVEDLLCAFGRHRAYENSAVANLPFSEATLDHARGELTRLATRAIGSLHGTAIARETSPFFVRVLKLEEDNEVRAQSRETVTTTCDQIDEIVAGILFRSNRDEVSLVSDERSGLFRKHVFEDESPDEHSARILSFFLGCAFARWDIRYATAELQVPTLLDPFAPLPVCPPGMLQGDDGLPLSPEAGRQLRAEGRYPLDVAWDGILVDDPNHPADVVGRVQEVLRVLWKDRADAIEHEACELLGVKSLRDWFRKPAGFFADHLKCYSKSRRQAPIYWPLSSPNGLYTVWLYYHRLTPDTLFTVLRDYLNPKLEFEERRAFQLRQEAGGTPSPSQRRDIAEAEELVEDIRALRAELERVAPLFRPNLNDGVIINYAPLWRMIGLPKWRKDCQAIWNELAQGDYDWAHLAMHLWPERVVPKCATDRSLAIAHGLEEVFWQEDPEKPGKWIARKVTEAEVRGLIAERSSAAVKAAVEELSVSGQHQGSDGSGRVQRRGSASAGGARKRGKKASAQEEELL